MKHLRQHTFTRLNLQRALGALWVIDGLLQAQPYMFSDDFARDVINPAGDHQPAAIAWAVHHSASLIGHAPWLTNAAFAGIQLALGIGLLAARRHRARWLAASVVWALGVWTLGEGLGGIASGTASILTGAPGAALLYAVLAVAAWPVPAADRPQPPSRTRPDIPSWVTFAWVATWLGAAALQLLGPQRSGPAVASALSNGPTALRTLNNRLSAAASEHGAIAVIITVATFAVIGLLPACGQRRLGYGLGGLVSVGIWIFGQDLGQLSSGRSTDVNTGPLLLLLAVACAFAQPSAAARPRASLRYTGSTASTGAVATT